MSTEPQRRYAESVHHNGEYLRIWLGRDELLPGNGRKIGIVIEACGIGLERAGIWIQRQAAEIRFRRLHALRRWGQ